MTTKPGRIGILNREQVSGMIFSQPCVALTKWAPALNSACFALQTDGYLTPALDASNFIYGWAFVPSAFEPGSTDESNGYWTAVADPYSWVLVCPSLMAVYRVPCTPAITQAEVGQCVDIGGVTTADGSQQYVTPGTNVTDVLIILAMPADGDTASCIVRLNPKEVQVDTA